MKSYKVKISLFVGFLVLPICADPVKNTISSVKNDKTVSVKKVEPSQKSSKKLTDLTTDKNLAININIGFIDSFSAMGTCKEGQKVRQELEAKRETLSKDIKREEEIITQTMSEYKSKSSMLSEAAREKEEKKLVKMERGYKNKIQECEEELKMDMQVKTEHLGRSVDEAVAIMAKEQKLDAVVDQMTGRVLYVAEKLDYTAAIKEIMDVNHDVKIAKNTQQGSKVVIADNKVTDKKQTVTT